MSSASALMGTILPRAEEIKCTLETCDIELSMYKYRPSLVANVIFAAIFGISAIIYGAQGFQSRKFLGFTVAMVLGCIAEAIGYVGRALMWKNPFDDVSIPVHFQPCQNTCTVANNPFYHLRTRLCYKYLASLLPLPS